jgi:hypothetical protein
MARKRGRPVQGEYAGKSEVMSFRITPETKAALARASEASGRSLSQEAEHQLRRALFHLGTGPTYAVLQTIGKAVETVVNLKKRDAHWTDDAYVFDQAVKAITEMFQLLRPVGVPPESLEQALELGGRLQGRLAMLELLREIQLVDTSIPLAKQTAHQRALAMLRADLGPLADRPQVYGLTAEKTRKQHEIGVEFGVLTRQVERDPDNVTPEETKRLWDLAGRLADLRGDDGEKQ